jgi:hypothetical protein
VTDDEDDDTDDDLTLADLQRKRGTSSVRKMQALLVLNLPSHPKKAKVSAQMRRASAYAMMIMNN